MRRAFGLFLAAAFLTTTLPVASAVETPATKSRARKIKKHKKQKKAKARWGNKR